MNVPLEATPETQSPEKFPSQLLNDTSISAILEHPFRAEDKASDRITEAIILALVRLTQFSNILLHPVALISDALMIAFPDNCEQPKNIATHPEVFINSASIRGSAEIGQETNMP